MAHTSRTRYEGEKKDGKKHGQGTLYCANGEVYQGAWYKDRRKGYGISIWPNGDQYSGDWDNDQRNGQGIFQYADGASYRGEWKNDQRNGLGLQTWPNGKRHYGLWVDDRPGEQDDVSDAVRSQADVRTAVEKMAMPPVCNTVRLARQFVKSLNWPATFFDSSGDNCFCSACYRADWKDMLTVGGGSYVVPREWASFGLTVDSTFWTNHDIWKQWIVTFHGTSKVAAQSILHLRQFCFPGDRLIDGTLLGIRPGHIRDQNYVFTSPTIKYSSSSTYSPIYSFYSDEDKKQYQAQLVLKCRQKPGTFQVQRETIGLGRKRICPVVSNEEMEYFSDRRASLVAYGLLVRVQERLA